jgi:iron complex transport system substrate-binding protein
MPAAAESGVSARDTAGRLVSLPRLASRIEVIPPGAVELLFKIGRGGVIASRGPDCDYPDEALAIPVSSKPRDAGGYDLLVVDSLDEFPAGARDGDRLKAFVYAPCDFRQLADAAMALGVLTGAGNEGVRLGASITGAVSRVRAIIERIPSAKYPRVFWIAGVDPFETCGSRSFPGSMIAEAGGRNPFGDLEGSAPSVLLEDAIARAPQVVVLAALDLPARGPGEERIIRILSDTPAGTEGRVLRIDPELAAHPGPRSPGLLLILARAFHPDLIP